MKNLRAIFRFSALATTSSGIYLIWLVGSFFVADKIRWRQKNFTTIYFFDDETIQNPNRKAFADALHAKVCKNFVPVL